jgi:flagellar motor switch/type III secretory pathway protein FliN
MPEPKPSDSRSAQPLDLFAPRTSSGVEGVEPARAVATALARDMRRLLPFLARQRAHALATEPRKVDSALKDEGLTEAGPAYVTWLRGETPNAWVLLAFDSDAILALLNGLFGANTPEPEPSANASEEPAKPEEEPALGEKLTLAQRALMRRVARDFAHALQAVLTAQGLPTLESLDLVALDAQVPCTLPEDALAVECSVETVERPWRVRLFLALPTLRGATTDDETNTNAGADMIQAILSVPVEVVAELGRIKMRLGQVLNLRSGDTLRLDSAASDPIALRVGGVTKFRAQPVISRGQVSIKVQSRVDDG